MTHTQESADGWTRFSRLLSTLLPVHGFQDLLCRLSDGWRELTGATAAVVSVRCPGETRFMGCVSREGNSPQMIVQETNRTAVWSAEEALNVFGSQIPAAHAPAEVVPFSADGSLLGGAILFAETGQTIDTCLVTELSLLSARLVQQAAVVESAKSVECDGDHFEQAKLDSLAEFAAGAGHEINNPLAAISGRVQLLLNEETDPAKRQSLKTIGGQAYRIRDMIGDLMLFARPPNPRCEALDLAETAAEVVAPLEEEAQGRGCRIEVQVTESVPIWADRVQLAVVISSLIRNSLDAASGGGPIVVAARSIQQPDGRLALLTVTDHGQSLNDADREHLFDPFYAGRQAGRGLGFGLSKCWRIVSNHGGRIQVESTPGGETTFSVFWPTEPFEKTE